MQNLSDINYYHYLRSVSRFSVSLKCCWSKQSGSIKAETKASLKPNAPKKIQLRVGCLFSPSFVISITLTTVTKANSLTNSTMVFGQITQNKRSTSAPFGLSMTPLLTPGNVIMLSHYSTRQKKFANIPKF